MMEAVDPLVTKLQLTVLAGDELNTHWGPVEGDSSGEYFTTLLKENGVTLFEYHPKGSVLCVVTLHDVRLFDTNKGTILHVLPVSGVRYVYFSPQGTYLVTWTPYHEEYGQKEIEKETQISKNEDRSDHEDTDTKKFNLRVWSVSSGQEVKCYSQRRLEGLTWPPLRWSDDEVIAVHQSQRGEFQFVRFDAERNVLSQEKNSNVDVQSSRSQEFRTSIRLQLAGATNFEIAPGPPPYKIAVFVPERYGSQASPGRVNVYHFPNFDRPVASKLFFKAQEAKMLWNATGTALLVETHTQIDSSGKSYYGESSLYYLSADGTLDINVPLSKEGPIHATAWSPRGNLFAVCYGHMPSQITLYSHKCVPLLDLGLAHRNKLVFNRQGTALVVGGFGGLQGQMDFWDLRPVLHKLNTRDVNVMARKFAVAQSPFAHHVEWSPDGNFLLTAVLFSRLKIDNGFTIFKLDGTILFQKKVEKCWRAMWRPTPPELFPNPKLPVPESPSTVDNSAESTRDSQRSVKGLTTGEKYRHPHYRGTSSNSQVGGRTKSATHQDEGPKNYINRLPGGTPKSSSTNLPVGYRPVKTPTQAGRGQPKKPKQNRTSHNVNQTTSHRGTEKEGSSSSPQQQQQPQSDAKKRKKIITKLKQIEELKMRRERGEQLKPEQIDKINREEALKKELQDLENPNRLELNNNVNK